MTAVISSIAGAVSGQYWPSGTTGHILTKTAGGTRTIWISDPLSSGVTISGTITPNLWGLESAIQCNCGARYEVLRWSVAAGGIVSSLGISTDSGLTEWGTSAAVRTAPTLTPTSTAFATGDRIVIVIYNDDGNGVTEATGRNWTLDYDAGTGIDGDSYLSFTETFSFSADSNNARPIPSQSDVHRWSGNSALVSTIGHRDSDADGPEAGNRPYSPKGLGYLTLLERPALLMLRGTPSTRAAAGIAGISFSVALAMACTTKSLRVSP